MSQVPPSCRSYSSICRVADGDGAPRPPLRLPHLSHLLPSSQIVAGCAGYAMENGDLHQDGCGGGLVADVRHGRRALRLPRAAPVLSPLLIHSSPAARRQARWLRLQARRPTGRLPTGGDGHGGLPRRRPGRLGKRRRRDWRERRRTRTADPPRLFGAGARPDERGGRPRATRRGEFGRMRAVAQVKTGRETGCAGGVRRSVGLLLEGSDLANVSL